MAIYSAIQRVWKTILAVVHTILELNGNFQALTERITKGPSLPSETPSMSYWFRNPPFPHLRDIQSPELPEEADVVIIGSGITGAAVARTLLKESHTKGRKIKVVVLEAREICSGATGRNGGHIKIAPYEMFERLEGKFGTERAAELVRFQLRHLECCLGLCKTEALDLAECRAVETADLFLNREMFEKAVRTMDRCMDIIPEFEFEVYGTSHARAAFKVSDHILGALSYRAGALWPYRFVTSIWDGLLKDYSDQLFVETMTPVLEIGVEGPICRPYRVHTHRGVVRCRHIVHATNAWMSRLLPKFNDKATGARAHMSAQNPGFERQGLGGNRSWSIIYGEKGFEYMIQRPSPGDAGDIMLDGGFFRSKGTGLDQIGIWDDSQIEALTESHLNGIIPTVFPPDTNLVRVGGNPKVLQQHWSGIISLTADGLPFVGRLDERLTGRRPSKQAIGSETQDQPSEWISAGYNGEGMVFAWLCGTALALMITGSEDENLPASPGFPGGRVKEWFPRELLLDYNRFSRLDIFDLANDL